MTSENIKWIVNLLAPRVIRRVQSYYQKLELDQNAFDKAKKIITKALEKEKSLTRPEIYKLLEDEKFETKGMRGLFTIGNLAMNAHICFGPKKGKQPTFVLVDDWVNKSKEIKGEEAMTEMAKLYFQSHGPAQIIDFMSWSGMNKTEVTRAIGNLKSLVKEEFNGKEYFMFPTKTLKTNHKKVFILSAYDEYTVAFKDRTDILQAPSLNPIAAVNGYWNAMLLDGIVIGMFRRVLKKEKIIFSFKPIIKLSNSQEELFEKEAHKYAGFYGLEAVIS